MAHDDADSMMLLTFADDDPEEVGQVIADVLLFCYNIFLHWRGFVSGSGLGRGFTAGPSHHLLHTVLRRTNHVLNRHEITYDNIHAYLILPFVQRDIQRHGYWMSVLSIDLLNVIDLYDILTERCDRVFERDQGATVVVRRLRPAPIEVFMGGRGGSGGASDAVCEPDIVGRCTLISWLCVPEGGDGDEKGDGGQGNAKKRRVGEIETVR